MAIIANVEILYQGVQYHPGEIIKDYDIDTLNLWLRYGSVRKTDLEKRLAEEKIYDEEIPMSNSFSEQVEKDASNIFLNGENKEFATIHKIGIVKGLKTISEKECSVVVDSDLYRERTIKDDIENISIDGLVFFIQKDEYLCNFKNLPGVGDSIKFDKKTYLIEALNDDMGILEFTIRAATG